MNELETYSDFLFYTGKDGKPHVRVILTDDTVWLNQRGMSELFGVESHTITYHLKEIFESRELDHEATTRKIRVVQPEGKREVEREIDFYNLDCIISVGYRVNSYQASQFRMWATRILKDYLLKGFAIDDERLKQGKLLFGKDYFQELLERIKEIRASERRFYQKITDIYAECSIDYDPNSPITQTFFATVQNKLEFAITHLTAPEIIRKRADATKPHMGLETWAKAPNGKIVKKDVTVAKNYLNKEEIGELNSIVNMYLDYAELQAKRFKMMKMKDWVEKLDAFLKFNEYDILLDGGKIKRSVADGFAEKQYEKFRVIQDEQYQSDFDKILVARIKETGQLPTESEMFNETKEIKAEIEETKDAAVEEEGVKLEKFNQDLKKLLNTKPPTKK